MVIAFLILLLLLFVVGESFPRNPINQTDLQVAVSDMRAWSYHGFVILLKLLNSTPEFIHPREITFLLPNDEELSNVAPSQEKLREFVFTHSIPKALLFNHMLRFPNGTLVPSSIPNRMLSITDNGSSGLFVNNARIVTPNVCLNSGIKCHGISTAIAFSGADSSMGPPSNDLNPKSTNSVTRNRNTKSSSAHWKKNHPSTSNIKL